MKYLKSILTRLRAWMTAPAYCGIRGCHSHYSLTKITLGAVAYGPLMAIYITLFALKWMWEVLVDDETNEERLRRETRESVERWYKQQKKDWRE